MEKEDFRILENLHIHPIASEAVKIGGMHDLWGRIMADLLKNSEDAGRKDEIRSKLEKKDVYNAVTLTLTYWIQTEATNATFDILVLAIQDVIPNFATTLKANRKTLKEGKIVKKKGVSFQGGGDSD